MKEIFAEVITIGDEILFGQITDTNTQYISQKLTEIGIKTVRKSSVGDTEQAILQILSEASQRANIIIMTGGLGPTKDDITKHTLCKYFNTHLISHAPTLAHVTAYFEKRNRPMLAINCEQANVPANAEVLFNDWGTAPGMWINSNNVIFISLPGVPYEMKLLMDNRVLPKLQSSFKTPCIVHQMVHTSGVGESFLAQIIQDWEANLPANLKLAYLPSLGIVKLRITGTGDDATVIKSEIEKQVKLLDILIKPYIFGYDYDTKLESEIGKLLLNKNKTLATAESCTGGKIAHKITSISGSSAYFYGGIVAYHNQIKTQILGVSTSDISTYGAVSQEVASLMAQGARQKLGTSFAIATTGIAGPNGGSEAKPVGTVWIAIATENQVIAKKFTFGTIRENNIELATIYGLKMLFDLLQKEGEK